MWCKASLRNSHLDQHQKVHSEAGLYGHPEYGVFLPRYWASVTTRNFTPGQGLLHAFAVGRPSFISPNSLLTRRSSCSDCGKLFRNHSTLVWHQRVHTGELPDKCSKCGKAFTHEHKLVKHQKIHSGERAYECSGCGKFFLDGFMLVIHQRVHTGERSYKCISVGNSLVAAAHSLDIGQKGFMNTSNVGNFCGTTKKKRLITHQPVYVAVTSYENSKYGNVFACNSGLIKHCWVCAWEMSSESSECWSQNYPFSSKKFTPEKELMGAANGERL